MKRMWLIAEYCPGPLYMGWHIYLRDTPERQRRNDDGSWGWLRRDHWLLASVHILLDFLGISMRPGGDGSCDDDGYAELAKRFRFGRQRIGGKPRGGLAVFLDDAGVCALPACAVSMGCLCAGHARDPRAADCDTSETPQFAAMTRDELISAVSALPGANAPQGYYLYVDCDDPALDVLLPQYEAIALCEEHAPKVARIEALCHGVDVRCLAANWSAESNVAHCDFHDCGAEIATGSLTDSGVDSALALTETDPLACAVSPYELMASASAMSGDDERWSVWEEHARRLLQCTAGDVATPFTSDARTP